MERKPCTFFCKQTGLNSAGGMHSETVYNPLVSIIIPVKNGSRTIDACLKAIKRSYYKNYEVIVVDDGSTDGTPDILKQHNCRILHAERGEGANNARNFGAGNAAGDLLVFVDSDIVVGRETILGIVETLEDNNTDAVVGIYTARHRHETFVSQYKNLWVRYSYLKSLPAIDWLFGSISGIKRAAFEKIGGFDVELLARHGHDDIELGKRFVRSRLNIVLNTDVEVEHLKNYTVRSFLKNEFDRSLGFAELAFRLRETSSSFIKGFVNVYPSFVISTMVSVAGAAIIVLAASGIIPYWYAGVPAGIYILLNIRFLNYLEQVRGLFAMIAMVPFLLLDHLICFAGSVCGVLRGLMKKRRQE